jgi:hypothetical protein
MNQLFINELVAEKDDACVQSFLHTSLIFERIYLKWKGTIKRLHGAIQ